MGESAEIASLRAEIEALKTQVMSMRSDMDVSGGAVSSSGTGGPATGGYGTPWAIPDGYRLPNSGGAGTALPYPYEVKKFSRDGQDTWAIRLHQNVLMVAGVYVNVSADSSGTELVPYDTGDSDDEDWFVCPGASDDARVYLNVEAEYTQEAIGGDDGYSHFDAALDIRRTKHIRVSRAWLSITPEVNSSMTSSPSTWGTLASGPYYTSTKWTFEICNISGGVPYQKVFGAINLTGPTCEVCRAFVSAEAGPDKKAGDLFAGIDPVTGLRLQRMIDVLNMSRDAAGVVSLSAPIALVAGSSNVHVQYMPKENGLLNEFRISVDGGDSYFSDDSDYDSDDSPLEVEPKSGLVLNGPVVDGEPYKLDLAGRAALNNDGETFGIRKIVQHAGYTSNPNTDASMYVLGCNHFPPGGLEVWPKGVQKVTGTGPIVATGPDSSGEVTISFSGSDSGSSSSPTTGMDVRVVTGVVPVANQDTNAGDVASRAKVQVIRRTIKILGPGTRDGVQEDFTQPSQDVEIKNLIGVPIQVVTGVEPVLSSGGTTLKLNIYRRNVYVLSTEDLNAPATPQASSGVTLPTVSSKSISLVTGVTPNWKTDGQMELQVSRRSITVLDSADTPVTSSVSVPLHKTDLVAGVKYDASTRKLQQLRVGGVTSEAVPSGDLNGYTDATVLTGSRINLVTGVTPSASDGTLTLTANRRPIDVLPTDTSGSATPDANPPSVSLGSEVTVIAGAIAKWANGQLVLEVDQKNVRVLGTPPSATVVQKGLGLYKQNFVAGSKYDTGSHTLTNKAVEGVRTSESAASLDGHVADGEVFAAEAHEAEVS